MSPRPTSRSRDLKRLIDDGYDVEIRDGHLLIHGVPYVTSTMEVALGTLVSTLDLAGDVTVTPGTHVAMWIGEHPCHADGTVLHEIAHAPAPASASLQMQWSFSSKPVGSSGYANYHEKMTTYIAMISAPALAVYPTVTARTYPVQRPVGDPAPFLFEDTSSARAGLGAVTDKIRGMKIAIVGLGGTGSWVLDLVARCPVGEIHLFDDDRFLQHNTFRSPGPTSVEELTGGPFKVDIYAKRWAVMRTGVIAHPERLGPQHTKLLAQMDFVFVCVDTGASRRGVVELLERVGCDFIDTGMGLLLDEDRAQVLGQVRTTLSTATTREQARQHLPLTGSLADDIYDQNIQTSEMNALNAVEAVTRWKKAVGFYTDLECEGSATYVIDGNHIVNTPVRLTDAAADAGEGESLLDGAA
ncbi:ThiF family adenylyltransferase [Aquipuribacter hungaricus]|uniref:ThiF family adenylyltransferase n=1 Tax=Aquipuribacter hungaricus TaxID=545624 RepID=A0ABV7WJY3_9MICO